MKTTHFHTRAWALVFAAALLTGACSTSGTESATAPAGSGAVAAPAPVFDVPALIGKNIDQVEQALGKADAVRSPTDDEQRTAGFEWKKAFTRQGYQLLVKYYPDTKEVYAFTLLNKGGVPGGLTTGGLEPIANVNPSDTTYQIQMEPEPGSRITQPDASKPPVLPRFIGITIVPTSTTPADTTAALPK